MFVKFFLVTLAALILLQFCSGKEKKLNDSIYDIARAGMMFAVEDCFRQMPRSVGKTKTYVRELFLFSNNIVYIFKTHGFFLQLLVMLLKSLDLPSWEYIVRI